MSRRAALDLRVRLLPGPCLWCWEIVDRGGPLMDSSWAAGWTAYASPEEAFAAGRARLAELRSADAAQTATPIEGKRGANMGCWSSPRWSGGALALAGLVAGVGAPGLAGAQERGGDWSWGMHPMSWMWGAWGLGMMVMMVVFWGVVIIGVVLAIRWLAGQGERSRSDRALAILRERYARGEINKDEFDAKKRDLT